MNTRELATVIWLVGLLALGLSRPSLRRSLVDIVKAFAKAAIVVPFALYIALLAAAVYLAYGMGLWTPKLLAPTVFWFFLSGLVLLFGFTDAGKQDRFFRTILKRVVGAGAFLEFLVSVKTFHIVFELALQPLVVLLVLLAQVAGSKPDQRPVKRLAESLLGAIGITLITLTIRSVIVERDTFDFGLQLRQLVLPLWLTLVSLPFMYLLALYAEHEQAFIRMRFGSGQSRLTWRARLAVMIGLRGRLTDVHALARGPAKQVGRERGYRAAREQVRAFRRGLADARVAEQEAADRLVRYAGVSGVDEQGRQLDRREFEGTCKALEWLCNCHWGWYPRQNRYRDDLLDKLGDFERHGLFEPHGIVMHVPKDGQAWYAYRRTVGGWVFAIGAAGPPTDQWKFDGPEPPNGLPGEDPAWGSTPFTDPLNWV